jgi:hypothetical protein
MRTVTGEGKKKSGQGDWIFCFPFLSDIDIHNSVTYIKRFRSGRETIAQNKLISALIICSV